MKILQFNILCAITFAFGNASQAQEHSYKWLNVSGISGKEKPLDHLRLQLENQSNRIPNERKGLWGQGLIAKVRVQAAKGDFSSLYKTGFGAYTYAQYGQDVFQQRSRVTLNALNLIESFPKVPHNYEFTRLRYLLEGFNVGLYPRRVVEIGVSLLQRRHNDWDVELTNWRIYNNWIDDFPRNKLLKLQRLQKKYPQKDLSGDFSTIYNVLGNTGDLSARKKGIVITRTKIHLLEATKHPSPREKEKLVGLRRWLRVQQKYETQYPHGVPSIIQYEKSMTRKRAAEKGFYAKI